MMPRPIVRVATLSFLLCTIGCQGGGRLPFQARGGSDRDGFDIARLHEKDGQLGKARELYEELRKSTVGVVSKNNIKCESTRHGLSSSL